MTTYSTIVKFFQDSGVFIYPSILVLAMGLAIAIERFIYLSRSRSTNRKMWDDLRPLLNSGKFQQALAVAAKSEAAIAKMVSRGIHRLKTAKRREEIDAAMEEGMMEIVPRLEKRTHYLATFANVVTLLGLLGTIIGLIKAFTADSSSAFSEGLTWATAVNALIRPMMVPSRPSKVTTLAKVAR